MKLYTRTGDEGKTSLIGGRTNKNDIRVEAYGTVDELNSFVGYAISLMNEIQELQDLQTDLTTIQHELFDLGSDLALYKRELMEYKVNADMVDNLERWIDRYEQENPPITRFILPGGSVQASALHVCRTVCRRAERLVVTLGQTAEINRETRKYLNRLSDFFFAAARTANARLKVTDVEYIRSAEVFKKQDEQK